MKLTGKRGTILAVVIGTAILGGSTVSAQDLGQWVSDTLLGVGTTLVLFIPLYFFQRGLDDHIDRVERATATRIDNVRLETATRVDELSDRVTTFEGEVGRRLEEVAASVSSRLADEKRRDVEVFRALGETPSREGLVDAMSRARTLGVVDPLHSPRVEVVERGIYVAVDCSSRPWSHGPSVRFEIVDERSEHLDEVVWSASMPIGDAMVELARALQKRSTHEFDVQAFWRGLSDLLQVGLRDPEFRPVVQLCPPQWVITPRAAVRYDGGYPYIAGAVELYEDAHFAASLREKPWIHEASFTAAETAVLALLQGPAAPF